MAKEVEIEYKSLLTEEAFTQLKTNYFPVDASPFQQTNYYFDTQAFALKNLNSGLRIRVRRDREPELTLKTPFEDQIGLLETTDQLPADFNTLTTPSTWPTGDVHTHLKELNVPVNDLILTAELTTHRLEKRIAPGILLVLDESWYHGKHDFELEMEVTDATAGYAFFTKFLADHEIPVTPGPNKIARAVRANLEK